MPPGLLCGPAYAWSSSPDPGSLIPVSMPINQIQKRPLLVRRQPAEDLSHLSEEGRRTDDVLGAGVHVAEQALNGSGAE